jgi:hypothetical protein
MFNPNSVRAATNSTSPQSPKPATAITTQPPPLPWESDPAATDGRGNDEDAEPSTGRESSRGFAMQLVLSGGTIAAMVVIGVFAGVLYSKSGRDDAAANTPVAENTNDAEAKGPAQQQAAKPDDGVPAQAPVLSDTHPPRPLAPLAPQRANAAPGQKADTPAVAAPLRYNLMPLIDLNQDVLEGKGKWHMQEKLLVCHEGHFAPRVQIRYVPPDEYDFTVGFTQHRLRNGVFLIMPKPGGGTFFWTVGFNNGASYGFSPLGSTKGGKLASLIAANEAYVTTVQVRRGSVRAFLDGSLLLDHGTDLSDMKTDHWHSVKNDRLLAVGCDDPTTFHRIWIAEISGKGKASR